MCVKVMSLSVAKRTEHSDPEGCCFEDRVGRWERLGYLVGCRRKGHC